MFIKVSQSHFSGFQVFKPINNISQLIFLLNFTYVRTCSMYFSWKIQEDFKLLLFICLLKFHRAISLVFRFLNLVNWLSLRFVASTGSQMRMRASGNCVGLPKREGPEAIISPISICHFNRLSRIRPDRTDNLQIMERFDVEFTTTSEYSKCTWHSGWGSTFLREARHFVGHLLAGVRWIYRHLHSVKCREHLFSTGSVILTVYKIPTLNLFAVHMHYKCRQMCREKRL